MKRETLRDALYIIALALLALIGLSATSCAPSKNIASIEATTDSLEHRRRSVVRVFLQDTIYMRPLPQSHDRVVTEADSSYLSNDYCTSTAKIDALGKLHHTLDTRDSAKLPTRTVYRDSIIIDTVVVFRRQLQERVVTKEVRKVTWWDRCLRIVSTALLAVVLWQNRKRIMTLLRLWRI